MKNRRFISPIFTLEAPHEGGSNAQADEPLDDATASTDDNSETASESEDSELEEEELDDGFDPKRAMSKIRKTNAENRKLRERAKQAEAKAKNAGELEADNEKLRIKNLRLQVALKHDIPFELASRLNGSTEEEITADAEKLLELFTRRAPGVQRGRENTVGESHKESTGVKTQSLDEIAKAFMPY